MASYSINLEHTRVVVTVPCNTRFDYADAAEMAKSQAPEGTAELRLLEVYTLNSRDQRVRWDAEDRRTTEYLFAFVPARPDLTPDAVANSIADVLTEYDDQKHKWDDYEIVALRKAVEQIKEIIADAEPLLSK